LFLISGEKKSQDGPLRFHSNVYEGDVLATGPGSHAEILVGKETLVTIHEDSALKFLEGAPGTTAILLTSGSLDLAVSRAGSAVTIHTPGATAVTWGGLIRISLADEPKPSLHTKMGQTIAFGMPARILGQPSAQREVFHAVEGSFQLRPASPGGRSITVEAGQAAQVVKGQVKTSVSAVPLQSPLPLPVIDRHTRPSAEGLQHLAARQRREAEALEHAVLEALGIKNPMPADDSSHHAILATTDGFPSLFQQQPFAQQPQPQPIPTAIIPTTGTPGVPSSPQPSPPTQTPPSPSPPSSGLLSGIHLPGLGLGNR
jgi:hypothetical protein